MSADKAAKLREEAALIAKAASLFGIAGEDTVKVSKPEGPEVPIKLNELLGRMERKAKKLETL